MKNCNKCNIEKDDTLFRHNRRVCKDCERADGRRYRRENKHKSKEWIEKNKEKMKKLQHDWYLKNKQKINNKFNERYHDDSSDFKKIKNYRTALSHMIKDKQKSNKYIGCKKDFLKKWLEFCFDKDMTFDNYGEYWVVDHVIPLVLRDKYEFEILSKWYNITPMLLEDNLRKNKYFLKENLEKQLILLQKFCEINKIKFEEYNNLAKHLDAGTSLEL